MREALGGMENEITAAFGETEKPRRTPPENLRKGDRVYIHSLNQEGTVIIAPKDTAGGEALIQAGIMQIKASLHDLSPAESGAEKKHEASVPRISKFRGITSEVDLRGMTPEEAVEATDKYLDDAFLSGFTNVSIIHGKGTGALRGAVHTRLKKHPHVKEFRLGKYGEGETGVTVVTLK
jgi:DNA mismatch repair protein MutS2